MKKLSILLALCLLLSCFAPAMAQAEPAEKTVTAGVTGIWMSMCHIMWPTKDVQQAFATPMFDQLITISGDGKLEPRLFNSWEINEDNTVVTVKLHPDATWHDGVPVTAEDVVFNTLLSTNPEWDGERVYYHLAGTDAGEKWTDGPEGVGVKAIDDKTVAFTLRVPMNLETFLKSYYRSYLVPAHLLKDIPVTELASNEFWEHPVGNGPFMFDSYIDGERFEYVANKDYYLGAPNFDRLIVKVVAASAMLSALKSGDVDVLLYSNVLPANDFEMAKEDDNLVVIANEGFAHDHLLINNKRFDKEQRVALNYIIDKSLLAMAAFGDYAKPAIAMFNKEQNHPFYSSKIEDMAYEYDPEKGAQMLKDSGFDFSKTYTIHVQAEQTARVAAATVLQQLLAAAGVQTEIVQADMATISGKLMGNECDFALMGSAGTPFDPNNEQFYYEVNQWNQLPDDRFIQLYKAIRGALSFEEQYELCEKIQVMQMEDSPMIYLYHKMQTFVYNKRLSNIDTTPFGLKNWKFEQWVVE